MARSKITEQERIFQYGVGAIRTILIHSKNVIFYHMERLNELGQWQGIIERYFTPEQFNKFLGEMEPQVSRTVSGSDRIRDSIHVSVNLAANDVQEDKSASPEDDGGQ